MARKFRTLVCRLCGEQRQPAMEASWVTASRCFMFIYFLLPYCVSAACRRRAQTNIRAEFPSGKLPTTRVRRRILPVQPLNNIVGADTCPMFTGEIAVGKSLLNAILHLFSGFFQLHTTQFLYHGFGFLAGCFLTLLGMDHLEHFSH